MELPELKFPIFGGNILKWTSFWETFRVFIHENPSLCDTQKYLYLASYLRDEALHVVECYCPSSYNAAVDALKRDFGDPYRIRAAHLRGLATLPVVKSTKHLKKLQNLYGSCQSHVGGLKALGPLTEVDNVLLTVLWLPKLPRELVVDFCRIHGEEIKLKDLLTFVRDAVFGHGCYVAPYPGSSTSSSGAEQPTSSDPAFSVKADHARGLLNLPELESAQNLTKLRKFYNDCQHHLNDLKPADQPIEECSSLMPVILFPKLPLDLRREICLKHEGKVRLEDLLSCLRREVEVREQYLRLCPPSTSSSSSASTSQPASQVRECPFCGVLHEAKSCPKSATERRDGLRANGRCFNCLRKGHRVSSCPIAHQRCRNCHENHHTLICTQSTESTPVENSAAQESVEVQRAINSAGDDDEGSLRKAVALQTATVVARGPKGEEFARLACAPNNLYSYITKSLASRLGLRSLHVKHIYTRNILGGDTVVRHRAPVHELEICSVHARDESLSLRVLQMPPVPNLPFIPTDSFADRIPNRCRPLADTMDLPIDIMIAGDYYYSVITDQVEKIPGGPSLLSSRFGWIVTGPVPVMVPDSRPVVILTHEAWEVSSNSDSALSDIGDDEELTGSAGSGTGISATGTEALSSAMAAPPRKGNHV